MRDHTKLRVFGSADQLAIAIYRASRRFPREERFGLQSQVRRAAVSVAANIVEGCARSSEADYLRFIEIAHSSACELEYEISLCERLGYFEPTEAIQLRNDATATAKGLNSLVRALRKRTR